MDFHLIPPHGEAVHILSTDDRGRIVTPLPAEPPSACPSNYPAQSAPAAATEVRVAI